MNEQRVRRTRPRRPDLESEEHEASTPEPRSAPDVDVAAVSRALATGHHETLQPAAILYLQREAGNARVAQMLGEKAKPTLAPGPGQPFLDHARAADEGYFVQRQLPERPADRTVSAASALRRIIVRARPAGKLRDISRILGGKSKEWVRGIEVNYNRDVHQAYVKVDFPGTPAQFHHFEGGAKLFMHDSPLRRDLRSALGMSDAQRFITALEEALPLRPPPGRAVAQAILSANQRQNAVSRATGEQSTLAQWLFREKNWVYLVSNVGKWAPSSGNPAGFFEIPAPLDRARWPGTADDPRTGDKEYLTQIQVNVLSVRKSIREKQADLRKTVAHSGWIEGWGTPGSPRGSEAVQWALGQRLLEYRSQLLVLRKETDAAIERLIPIRFIWGPQPRTTRDLVRGG